MCVCVTFTLTIHMHAINAQIDSRNIDLFRNIFRYGLVDIYKTEYVTGVTTTWPAYVSGAVGTSCL
jgi:hypothetical protein